MTTRARGALMAVVILVGVVDVVVLVPGSVLLLGAETASGRIAGALPIAVLATWVLAGRALSRDERLVRRSVLVPAIASVGLGVALFALTPPGDAPPSSKVHSTYLGPKPYPRFAVANLVPEIDQILLGTYFVPALDPIIDARAARHIRDVTMKLYRPMEQEADFRALGSVMSYAYSDEPSGHLYEYVPEHAPGERLPVLIFLHGSAGNFKSYVYAWRSLADSERVIVVCPSFGFGNWYAPGGVDTIERVREHVVRDLPSDPSRVILAGLSNGGTGVTREAARHPSDYAGLVLVSAVIEPAVTRTEAFRDGWRSRPILVLHGTADDRIPFANVEAEEEALAASGAKVTFVPVPGEDHFLFFSKLEESLDAVRSWMSPVIRPEGRSAR